jgi:hypothetical protein
MTLNVGTVTFQKFHAQDPEVSVERVERRRRQAVGPEIPIPHRCIAYPIDDGVYDGSGLSISL